MINRAERLFAQVSMDEAKRELESARKDLAVAQQAFKSLINMEEGSDVRTTTPYSLMRRFLRLNTSRIWFR